MNKLMLLCVLAVGVLAPGISQANREEYSLLVAPARYSVIQVMFDVIEQRPAVLVSYQGEAATANPALHVWNGVTWNPIALHDLRELSFLQRTPTQAIIIGDDSLVPTSVRDTLSGLPQVFVVRELGTSPMLNELGRIFDWSSREWRWFSKRYNLSLEDEAEPARRSSWYDQTGPLRKEDAPAYPAAPVGYQYNDTTGPAATTEPSLAPPPAIERPSDLPTTAPIVRSDIDELIEALDAEHPQAGDEVEAQEKFPIK